MGGLTKLFSHGSWLSAYFPYSGSMNTIAFNCGGSTCTLIFFIKYVLQYPCTRDPWLVEFSMQNYGYTDGLL